MPDSKFKNRLLFLGIAISHLIILGMIFYWQPFWGLMDDGHNVRRMADIETHGFWPYIKITLISDISWGMLRLFIIPMYYLVYGPFTENPTLTFAWNFFVSSAATISLLYALSKSGLQQSMESVFKSKIEQNFLLALLIAFTLIFPWYHYLFSSPSLQEKIVFLGLAVNLLFLSSKKAQDSKTFYALSPLVLSLGFLTKNHFVFVIPAVLSTYAFASWRFSQKIHWPRILYILCFAFAWTGSLLLISKSGTYTSGQFSLNNVWPNMMSSKSFWLLSALNGLALGLIALKFLRHQPTPLTWQNYLPIVGPILSVQMFLLGMLGWRLGGYLNSFMAPLFSVTLLSLFFFLPKANGRQLLRFGALASLCVATCAYQSYISFSFLASIRSVLQAPATARIIEEDQWKLYASGNEGSDHLKNFLRDFFGQPEAMVYYSDSQYRALFLDHLSQNSPKHTYWFGSPMWMPLPLGTYPELDFPQRELVVGDGSKFKMSLWKVPVIQAE